MANDTIHLGYRPGDENLPYNKKKPAKFRPPDPVQFGFDFQSQLAKELENEFDIPSFLKEHLWTAEMDEIQKAFKVSSGVGDKDNLTSQQLNDIQATGEEPELPGAMGLSINLYDLATDPKKALTKLAEESWKNITSIEELEERMSERLLQRILFGENTKSLKDPNDPYLFQQTAEDIYTRSTINYGGVELTQEPGQKNPLQLTSKNGFRRGLNSFRKKVVDGVEVEVTNDDLYEKVAHSALDFTKVSKAGSARDKAYESYLSSLQDVLVAELQNWDGEISPDMSKRLASLNAKGTRGHINEAVLKDILNRSREGFLARSAVIDGVEYVSGEFKVTKNKVSGAKGFSGVLENFTVEGYKDNALKTGKSTYQLLEQSINTLGANIQVTEERISNAKKLLTGEALATYTKSVAPVEELLGQLKSTVFDIKPGETSLPLNAVQPGLVNIKLGTGVVSPRVRKILNNIQHNVDSVATRADAAQLMVQFNNITSGGLNPTKAGLSVSTVFHPSLQFKLKRELIEQGLEGQLSANGVLNLDDVGVLTEVLGINDARALKVITRRLQNMREWDAFREALQNFDGGKLWRNYYYTKRIRDSLKVFTPSYWVSKGMERTQYLGLKIDETTLDKSPGVIRWLVTESPLSLLYIHRFNISVEFSGFAKGTVFKLQGGSHFGGLSKLHELYKTGAFSEDETKGFLKFLASVKDEHWDMNMATWEMKLATVMKDQEQARELMKKLTGFSNWMQKTGRKLLGKHADEADDLLKFFLALIHHDANTGTGSITTAYMGLIDKLAVQLNKLQSLFLTKFGRFIGPLIFAKQAIAEFVTDALNGFILAITGGTATPLTPILKFVIQWTVVKVLDFGEKIFQAIFKGDMSFVFKGFEKSIKRIYKYVLYASIVPALCGCLAMLIFTVLLSSINPVNVARTAAYSAGAAFSATVFGSLGPIIAGIFGPGGDGNYFSQRDPAWLNVLIGNSGMTLGAVGCLITSVAIVLRYYGIYMTPPQLAAIPEYFSGALWAWPTIQGHTWQKYVNIDDELAAGHPVIIGLTNVPSGTHFIVFTKKDGNDYIAHDPWIGPDIRFTDHYSFSQIYFTAVLR